MLFAKRSLKEGRKMVMKFVESILKNTTIERLNAAREKGFYDLSSIYDGFLQLITFKNYGRWVLPTLPT